MTAVEHIQKSIMELENERARTYSALDREREAFDAVPPSIRTQDPVAAEIESEIAELEKGREHLDIQIATLQKAVKAIKETPTPCSLDDH